jgi:anti-sigma B factor antagonist
MALWIDVEDAPERVLLVLSGELDLSTAPKLREALVEVIADDRKVVVDLERLTFLDSVGLGMLVSGLKRARARDGELEVVCTNRAVLRPFELTGLDEVFTIRDRRP